MTHTTDIDLDDLESYLVGLDETGSNLTSTWIADSSKDWSASKEEALNELEELFREAVVLTNSSS